MSMIAEQYQDDKDRSKVLGMILGGIALGVLGESLNDKYEHQTSRVIILEVSPQSDTLMVARLTNSSDT